MTKKVSKVMSAREAVERFIPDGCSLSIANFLHSTPYALIYEIIRQRKKDLVIWSQSGLIELDLLIAGGCVRKIITAYNYRVGGEWASTEFERALKEGRIEVEDLSNFTVLAMLWAGALGYSFIPVLSGIKETDIFKIRTILGEDKFKIIKCPFTGKDTVVVAGVNPDVAIFHCQRADEYGNAQYWGSIGNSKWATLACKRIIVSCEEIVDHDVIKYSPHHTLIPGFRVDAVVEEPWGAHPSDLLGYYNADVPFLGQFFFQNNTAEGIQQFLKEWIYDLADRKEYIEHYIERFGADQLFRLKARTHPSYPADYGSSTVMPWDETGYSEALDITREEFDQILEKEGGVIEWEIEEK